MSVRFRVGLAVVAMMSVSAAPAMLWAAQANGPTITFQVDDKLSDTQLDEEITVSINHLPVGVLKVNADKPDDSLTVTVPAAPSYHYDLCGRLKGRGKDGKAVDHKIDNGGDFTFDLNGHVLLSYSEKATVFWLQDETPGQHVVMARSLNAGHSCSETVAMR